VSTRARRTRTLQQLVTTYQPHRCRHHDQTARRQSPFCGAGGPWPML